MAHPFENLPLVLVSGQARSGTTILTKAIGAHPQVFSNLRESNYLADVIRLVQTNLAKRNVVAQLTQTPAHFQAQFRTALLNVLFPDPMISDVPRCVSTFSSLQIDIADTLEIFFDGLLIANIVRNGVEVVASRMKHVQIGKFTFEDHCVAWSHAIDMAKWGEGRDCFLLIRHEDLLDDNLVATVFDKLQQRLGIEHSQTCCEFVLSNQINSQFESSDAVNRRKELSQRNLRWTSWTETQRKTFEEICSASMSYFGYPIPWQVDSAPANQ